MQDAPQQVSKQDPLPGSIDYQINHEKKDPLPPQLPRYAQPVQVSRAKPLTGIYVLALLLVGNALYLFVKSSGTTDTENFFKLFGAIGVLAGIGLITRHNWARLFTLSLCYLGAVASVVSLRFVSVIIYTIAIVYLNLPHVTEEF